MGYARKLKPPVSDCATSATLGVRMEGSTVSVAYTSLKFTKPAVDVGQIVWVESCDPGLPSLLPGANVFSAAGGSSLHERNIPRMRLGLWLIGQPDRLGLKKLRCRNPVLVVAAMMMTPAQPEDLSFVAMGAGNCHAGGGTRPGRDGNP
jgi:hypothetical protein